MDLLHALTSPVLFGGDTFTAYRDPAAVYHDGWFHLFFTLVRADQEGKVSMVTAHSRDLRTWDDIRPLTLRDPARNFSSPGDAVRDGRDWVLCLQTYPRPNGEKYGNGDARLWTMRSPDLERWDEPEQGARRTCGGDGPDDRPLPASG